MTNPQPSDSTGRTDKYVLRFERPGHREELKQEAQRQKRSLNKHLLLLIERGQASEQQPQGAQA